ncbi:hypothetical protein [Aeromonas hydrophila]|uniref:hypothetical protein n=1 Tax=Aeromonas hydrophila TaxID=644 RepID=UPI000B0AF553|nr:hypothetical protein [Aeromonas hydrophila]
MTGIESSAKLLHQKIDEMQNELTALMRADDHKAIEIEFGKFLAEFSKIGTYNKVMWPVTQSRKWWSFFEETSQYKLASVLISLIDNRLAICESTELESLLFARLELLWNITKTPSSLRSIALGLVDKYPHNIEFIHTAAHIFGEDKEYSFKAIKLYRRCIEEWGKEHSELIKYTYNLELGVFRDTLEDKDYLNAEKQIDYIMSFAFYQKNAMFHNNSIMYKERLRDRKFTEATALKIERELTQTVINESVQQGKKNIEQLGLFSAVITFIVTAAASALNSDKTMTPLILVSIGVILILFISTIALLNNPPKKPIRDFRVYLVLFYAVLTIYVVNSTLDIGGASLIKKSRNDSVNLAPPSENSKLKVGNPNGKVQSTPSSHAISGASPTK